METYNILQNYWWFIISLLGAILVFMLFVQGGQSLIFSLSKNPSHRDDFINATGLRWGITFTTLVTFGGAFFASFPLFYSTSFGGAYWVWILILLCFVVQAVSYEYQSKKGNILGQKTFRIFLWINGVFAPLLLGTAVGTFFNGAEFIVEKENLSSMAMPVVSQWVNPLHGLEAVFVLWNVLLGLAVLFLSRTQALLYFINQVKDKEVDEISRKRLWWNASLFLLFFLTFLVHLLLQDGLTYDPNTKLFEIENFKYLHNFLEMPLLIALFLLGVISVLYGIIRTLLSNSWKKGIWFSGVGTVLVVLILFLVAGWNNTAFYPSIVDMQSSLSIANASSSLYTLKTMAYVSIAVPFVLAYIAYVWRKL